MNKDTGYDKAKDDIARHGILHAMDKAEVLDGEFGEGYAKAVHQQMTQAVYTRA